MSDPYLEFIASRRDHGETEEQIAENLAQAMECPLCPFCNKRPANMLCDFILGFTRDEEHFEKFGRLCYATDAEMFTCDRPVCSECSIHVGTIFWHGEGGGGAQTQDHCPQCANDITIETKPLHPIQARELRKMMWKRSAGRLAIVDTPPAEP